MSKKNETKPLKQPAVMRSFSSQILIKMKSISNETDFKELINEYVNYTKDKGYSLPIEVIPELIELAERGKHRMVYFYLRVVQGMMYGFAIKQAVEYSDEQIMSILNACEWSS
jgi:uncharacterized protein YaaR (DUF327 family)